MAYQYSERDSRYGDPFDQDAVNLDPFDPNQTIIDQPERPLDEVSPDQITANQNNFSLPKADLVRLSTDAARTITGFAGARPGFFVVCNVGTVAGRDVVLAHDSASSSAENRILCHTAPSNITLNPGESVSMIYDFTSARWRTIGFI